MLMATQFDPRNTKQNDAQRQVLISVEYANLRYRLEKAIEAVGAIPTARGKEKRACAAPAGSHGLLISFVIDRGAYSAVSKNNH